MDKVNLTKDADALLCALYKEYLQKRKDGTPKDTAKILGSADEIQKKIVPEWNLGDVEGTLRELEEAGMISVFDADNTVYFSQLINEGIIYMENRFKNGLSDLLDYLQKVKSILLW